jgi:hypothetical protein
MSSSVKAKAFDYANVSPATAQFVQQQTGEIRVLMKRTAQYIVEIGHKLTLIKENLGHGHFLEWLKVEFEWTDETARRFMNVAQQFSENPQIVAFAPSALYLLAAPSVPEAARAEAIARAQAGENITHKIAQQIKHKYTSSTPSRRTVTSSVQVTHFQPPPETSLNLPSEHPIAIRLAVEPSQLETLKSAAFQAGQSHVSVENNVVQPGDWWQLGDRHILYCGDPRSVQFQKHLPKQVSLSLAFPPHQDWHLQLSCNAKAALALFNSYPDQDLKTLRELVHQAFLLYSESEDTVIFAYLPETGLLLLADQLECRCFIAEPNLQRCEEVLTAWKLIQQHAQKLHQN